MRTVYIVTYVLQHVYVVCEFALYFHLRRARKWEYDSVRRKKNTAVRIPHDLVSFPPGEPAGWAGCNVHRGEIFRQRTHFPRFPLERLPTLEGGGANFHWGETYEVMWYYTPFAKSSQMELPSRGREGKKGP